MLFTCEASGLPTVKLSFFTLFFPGIRFQNIPLPRGIAFLDWEIEKWFSHSQYDLDGKIVLSSPLAVCMVAVSSGTICWKKNCVTTFLSFADVNSNLLIWERSLRRFCRPRLRETSFCLVER